MPKDPNTYTMAAKAITSVRRSPECRIDYNAKLRPKYMKNLNIHQYMRTRVTFLREGYLKRSRKLYYLATFFVSMIPPTKNFMVSV